MVKLAFVEILIAQMPYLMIGQDEAGNKYVAGWDGNKIYVTINHETFYVYQADADEWEELEERIK